jgi:hypothetical protein
MERRYVLRFESGERRGETLPLAAGAASTFGRRPGNTVQIVDASVSGRHAEFVVDESGVLLRDLGSTNGTRIGAERVSERRLAHGDQVLLGNIRLLFIDGEVDAAPPMTAPSAVDSDGLTGSPEAIGEEVQTVSAEQIARTRGGKRSWVTWVVLVVLVGGGGGAWFWLKSQGGGAEGPTVRPVSDVPGNLLAEGFSFEDGGEAWSAVEQGPSAFGEDPSARRSGEVGLSAEVLAGEWAEHRSADVRAPRGRALEVRGWIEAEDANARLGVVFEDSTGVAGPVTVWSLPVASGGGFEPVELVALVPGGYDRARAALHVAPSGQSVGTAGADDVSLVPVDAGQKTVSNGEFELFLLGDPGQVANLFKIDRVLLSGLAVTQGASSGRARLGLETLEHGMRLTPASGGVLGLRVEPALAGGGVATTGEGGYRTHQVDFERDGATALLFGSGRDLVRLGFEAPVSVTGRPDGEAFQLHVTLSAAASFDLQLSFREERNEAQNLARDARQAEEDERLGEAIGTWGHVIDDYPFETALLQEAGAARARLVDAGLHEVRDLRLRVERARFFRLVDLYRICSTEVADVARRYVGSEVQASAVELTAEIDSELSGLEADLDRHERGRLAAIVRTLEASESPKLAGRVREYLNERYGAAGGEQ